MTAVDRPLPRLADGLAGIFTDTAQWQLSGDHTDSTSAIGELRVDRLLAGTRSTQRLPTADTGKSCRVVEGCSVALSPASAVGKQQMFRPPRCPPRARSLPPFADPQSCAVANPQPRHQGDGGADDTSRGRAHRRGVPQRRDSICPRAKLVSDCRRTPCTL